mgnify:CR=1 FL=1
MMAGSSKGTLNLGTNSSGKPAIRLSPSSRGDGRRRREVLEDEEVTAKQARAEAEFQDKIAVRVLFSKLAHNHMTAAEVGVRLLSVLRRCPGLWTEGAKGISATTLGGDGGMSDRLAPDLLPLPVPRFKILSDAGIEGVFLTAERGTKAQYLVGTQAWTILAIESLNLFHSNGASAGAPPSGSEAQRKAVQLIYEECADFCKHGKGMTSGNPQKALGQKLESYWGDTVATAEEMTLEQVIPTLPDVGIAGSVPIVRVIEGQLRDQIRDPVSVMLPKDEWPLSPPRATTMLKDKSEWPALAQEIWIRDLARWLPIQEVFHHDGTPIINGLFGVLKDKDVPGKPGLKQLRLICNLVPSNCYVRTLKGDVDHLPYILQLSSIVLLNDEYLLLSQEDMSCAFYFFGLPEELCPYFAVGMPVNFKDLVGNPENKARSRKLSGSWGTDGIGYLCLRVLPMGWKSAVGIMQAVHRHLMRVEKPMGAAFRKVAKSRKHACSPQVKTRGQGKPGRSIWITFSPWKCISPARFRKL